MELDKKSIQKELDKVQATMKSNKEKADALIAENADLTAKKDRLVKSLKAIEKMEAEIAKNLEGYLDEPVKKAKKAVKEKAEEVKAEVKETAETTEKLVSSLFDDKD